MLAGLFCQMTCIYKFIGLFIRLFARVSSDINVFYYPDDG